MRQYANLLCIIAAVSIAQGAQAGNRSAVDIKAGRLGDALIQLGQQTGNSIGISDQRLTAITVKGVRGRMSVDEAIRRLLAGKPARAIRINARSWRIVAATPTQANRAAPAQPKQRTTAFPPEHAETSVPPVEIIVTASKRETPLKMLPATVSLLRGDNLPQAWTLAVQLPYWKSCQVFPQPMQVRGETNCLSVG